MVNSLLKVILFLLAFFLIGCGSPPFVDSFKKAQEFRYKADEESLKKAIDEYEKAFLYAFESLDGKYEAEKSLGILLSYDKKFIEAIKVLEKVRLVKSDDPEVLYHLGFSYLNLSLELNDEAAKVENSKLAEKVFKQGLNVDQENDALYYGLGVVAGIVDKDIGTGLDYLDKAYALNPKNINTLFALGNLHFQNGENTLALKYFEEIVANFSNPEHATQVEKAKENINRIKS